MLLKRRRSMAKEIEATLRRRHHHHSRHHCRPDLFHLLLGPLPVVMDSVPQDLEQESEYWLGEEMEEPEVEEVAPG